MKSLSISIIGLQTLVPVFVVAQDVVEAPDATTIVEATPVPIDETIVPSTPSTPTTTEDTQVVISPQSATSTQDSIDSTIIENTIDPQTATSSPDNTIQVVATSTGEVIPVDNSVPASTHTNVTTPVPGSWDVTIVEIMDTANNSAEDPQSQPVAQFNIKDIDGDARYQIAIEGEVINTKSITEWSPENREDVNSISITEAPDLSVGGTGEILEVSGVCTDPYYVILIYKNPEDYDKEPGSYIYNKAFDCKVGSYRYSIEELPPTLEEGRYYIMVAGQGDTGSWKPISALSAITLKRETQ